MEKKKVVVGLSGGVDSSVAAYLLKEKGYEVVGVTMRLWEESKETACCQNKAIEDAKKVAEALGIPYHVMDFQKEFDDKVISYFVEEYRSGRTPNPCVVCNRCIKWEALLKRAEELGADYLATGHYAQVERLSNGRYAIKHSATKTKDQTYALYDLKQEQLEKTLMPVGEYTKEEIRELAEKLQLPIAKKPDSQDICFIPDGDYAAFIERRTHLQPEPGNFVSVDGKVLGKHKGLIHYTVGQRKGLGLSMGVPVFVLEIRPETNEVVVGSNEDSMTREVYAHKLNLMSADHLEDGQRVFAKIRYNHKGGWCIVKRIGEDEICCVFDELQRAVTPGQALVMYEGDYVLGGGIIKR